MIEIVREVFAPSALGGAVTAYVMTGAKPALRADLPPAELEAKEAA